VIFPTIEFAAFFVVTLALSWLLMPRPRLWKPFVLGASYFFYGFADARFVLLIIASTLLNQTAARAIHRCRDRPARAAHVLAAAVVCDLGLLGWFKYYGFFALSVDRALADVGLPAPLPLLQVALPVGISFFTFQAISYVVDVRRGTTPPATLLDFAVYEAFFPHLVAGPIVRASEFLPQLSTPRDPGRVPVARAAFLILGGLVKKVVLADVLASHLVDPVFDAPGQHSSGEILVAVYGYAVQIYCDFSAYSDIAIGIALLLGFRFPDNFDRPYASRSLQEFWRRWHMTLSRWLRDHVYLPLGGNRRGRRRTCVNLLVTMTLGGLWHGASWTFVLWGALHGTALVLERQLRAWRARPAGAPAPLGIPWPRAAVPVASAPGRAAAVPDRAGATTACPAAVLSTGSVATAGGPLAAAAPADTAAPHIAAPTNTATTVAIANHNTAAPVDTMVTEPPRPPVSRAAAARAWTARLAVFHFVCATWVLFRAPDLATAGRLSARLLTAPGPTPLVTPSVLAAIAAGLATAAAPRGWWTAAQVRFARLPPATQIALLTLSIMITYAIAGPGQVAPFIYFRF
jgi:D-alanyl-lipoteichoic acid acyltransferase DltB (MBOAT superfamily)